MQWRLQCHPVSRWRKGQFCVHLWPNTTRLHLVGCQLVWWQWFRITNRPIPLGCWIKEKCCICWNWSKTCSNLLLVDYDRQMYRNQNTRDYMIWHLECWKNNESTAHLGWRHIGIKYGHIWGLMNWKILKSSHLQVSRCIWQTQKLSWMVSPFEFLPRFSVSMTLSWPISISSMNWTAPNWGIYKFCGSPKAVLSLFLLGIEIDIKMVWKMNMDIEIY